MLDEAGLPYLRVELDATWQIRGDGHPDRTPPARSQSPSQLPARALTPPRVCRLFTEGVRRPQQCQLLAAAQHLARYSAVL